MRKACYCENSLCKVKKLHRECPNEGILFCAYIGQICRPCAEYMPQEYLEPERWEPELRVFDEDSTTEEIVDEILRVTGFYHE